MNIVWLKGAKKLHAYYYGRWDRAMCGARSCTRIGPSYLPRCTICQRRLWKLGHGAPR